MPASNYASVPVTSRHTTRSPKAEAEVLAATRPDRTVDYRALSSDTLDQIVHVSDFVDTAWEKYDL